MVSKDGAQIRKQRIQQIARFIHSLLHEHMEIPLSKTLATLQYEHGLSKEKILEYLHILEDLGRFIIDDEEDRIKKNN